MEEPEEVDETMNIKKLKFKRELENIECDKERNKREIMDKINVVAIDESARVQMMIHKQLEQLRSKQLDLEDAARDHNLDIEKMREKAKRASINSDQVYKSDYKERNNVFTDPLRTTKLMSET